MTSFSAKRLMSPRTLIRPARIAATVPTSMSGTRPSSSIICSGPFFARVIPSFSIDPTASRRVEEVRDPRRQAPLGNGECEDR